MTQPILSGARCVAAIAVVVAAAACFSERSTGDVVVAGNCTTPSSAGGATVVFIKSFAYVPPTAHVKAGGSVAWVNCEPTAIAHTSTGDGGAWESGSLAQDAAFVRTFPAAGTFAYHCAIHPSMKATVIVDP